MVRNAAWDHVRDAFKSGTMLSLHKPAAIRSLASFSSRLQSFDEEEGVDVDGGFGDVLEQEDMDADVFFKIVRARPGQQICVKPAPGVSHWLDDFDAAVTQHAVVSRNLEGTQVRVRGEPRAPDGGSFSSIDLLRCNEPLALVDLRANLRSWTSADVEFSLAVDTRVGTAAICAMVQKLLIANALPNSGFPCVMEHADLDHALDISVLEEMRELHVVERVRATADYSTWELTPDGVAALQPVVVLCNARPALSCREGVPLREQTRWEVLSGLLSTGWVICTSIGKENPSPYESSS